MGEHADDFIDYIIDRHIFFGDFDEPRVEYQTCNRCGKPGLEWMQRPRDGKWRLIERDPKRHREYSIHVCDRPTYGVDLRRFLESI